jgi:hypothetical protein
MTLARFVYSTLPESEGEQEAEMSRFSAEPVSVADLARGPWRWAQNWHDLIFVHWPIPAESLAPVPARFELDLFDDRAWVSAVAFQLTTRLRGLPRLPLCSSFLELNLRTYVRCGGEKGVWFLSMHGNSRLAVWLGRRLTPLPYRFAHMTMSNRGEVRRFIGTSARRSLVALESFPIGDERPASDDPLDSWLLERYHAFVPDSLRTWQMKVRHAPWQIQPAAGRVAAGPLGDPWQLNLDRPPARIHLSAGLAAWVEPFHPIRSADHHEPALNLHDRAGADLRHQPF